MENIVEKEHLIEMLRNAFAEQTRGWTPGADSRSYLGVAKDLMKFWPRDVKELLPRILIEALSEEMPFKGRTLDLECLLGLLSMEGFDNKTIAEREGDDLKEWKQDIFKDYDKHQACALYRSFVFLFSLYKDENPFVGFPNDFEAVLKYWGNRGECGSS